MQKTTTLKIIGHRGAKGLAPENTLAGVRKALEHNVDEIEFDVRVTKDNVVICLHDPHLTDAAGTILPLNQHSYAELKEHKPDLATFIDFMDAAGKTMPMLIEVKPGEPAAPIARDIRALIDGGRSPKTMLLGSFSQRTLLDLHHELPEIEKVVIERWSSVKAVLRARQVGARRLNMRSWWLWAPVIRGLSKRGYQLAPYTLDDPVKARRWHKHGLYGAITDFPDRFEQA